MRLEDQTVVSLYEYSFSRVGVEVLDAFQARCGTKMMMEFLGIEGRNIDVNAVSSRRGDWKLCL